MKRRSFKITVDHLGPETIHADEIHVPDLLAWIRELNDTGLYEARTDGRFVFVRTHEGTRTLTVP